MAFKSYLRFLLVVGSFLFLNYQTALGASYPSGPIKIIVGYNAGGPTDTYARMLAAHLAESFGQPVIVQNIPGAATMKAGVAVSRAKPDGLTLFFTTNATYINLLLRKEIPYKKSSFDPIALGYSGAAYIVVPNDSKFNSLADLIKFARENPKKLNYATTAVGGYVHLVGEYFNDTFGTEIIPVGYKGGAKALEGVIKGEVDFSFIGASAAVPQIKGGRVKALAVTEPNRVSDFPNIPTVDESVEVLGISNLGWDTGAWYGLLAPKGLSPEVTAILHKELNAFLEKDSIKKRLKSEGNTSAAGMSTKDYKTFIDADMKIWAEVIKNRNIKLN